MKRQIGSLQRQAGKARRYQALLADLQVLDTHHSRKQLERLEHDLAACRGEIERSNKNARRELRSTIAKRDLGATTQRTRPTRHAKSQTRVAKWNGSKARSAQNRSRIEFNRQRAEEIAELIARAGSEIATAEAKRQAQQTQMKDANALIEKTAKLLQSKKEKLTELTELTAKLRETRDAREAELKTLQLALSKNESRISTLEDEVSGITIRREATGERLRELDEAIAQAHEMRSTAESALSAARAATETEQQQVDLLLTEMRSIEEQLGQDRHLLADAEKKLINLEGALAEKGSRLEVLKQLNEEGEGLAEGSQAILKGLDDPARIQGSLTGALVAQLDVDPKFVAAIEARWGRNLHAIVLQNVGRRHRNHFERSRKRNWARRRSSLKTLTDRRHRRSEDCSGRRSGLGARQSECAGGAPAFAASVVARCRDLPRSRSSDPLQARDAAVCCRNADRRIHFD